MGRLTFEVVSQSPFAWGSLCLSEKKLQAPSASEMSLKEAIGFLKEK